MRRRLVVMVVAALAAAALVVAGCSGDVSARPTTTPAPAASSSTSGPPASSTTAATTRAPTSTAATTPAPPTTPATTSAPPPIERTPIEVRGDGLGVVDFGTPVDDAMSLLVAVLGEPATDDMPYPGESIFPGSYFRIVRWAEPPLRVMFMDWNGDAVRDVPTFQYYDVGPSDELRTPEGIRADALFADVLAAYGDGVEVFAPDECTPGWTFAIGRDADDGARFLRGGLDGHPDDPTTRLTGLRSGIEMGPC